MLTPVEHIIACIAEEAGEIAQAAGKILRFGLHDTHEKTGNVPNIELLVSEVNQLLGALDALSIYGLDISRVGLEADRLAKVKRIAQFMEYARERGSLQIQ